MTPALVQIERRGSRDHWIVGDQRDAARACRGFRDARADAPDCTGCVCRAVGNAAAQINHGRAIKIGGRDRRKFRQVRLRRRPRRELGADAFD